MANKAFIEDHEALKMAVAQRIFGFAENEGWWFDWHHFQLFRRNLREDFYQQTKCLDIIQNGDPSDDDTSDWDSDE